MPNSTLARRLARGCLMPVIVMALCLAYLLSPIDFIPDFIPVLGFLDDALAIIAGLAFVLSGSGRQPTSQRDHH